MSLIAVGAVPADADPIENDGFFPEIDPADVRKSMRLDGTVTPERLKVAIVEAMLDVNAQLEAWKLAQIAAGVSSVDDIDGPTVDGKNAQEHRYMRAVYCLAAASIEDRYANFEATGDGKKRADGKECMADDYRRDASWAIRDILGIRRTTVELI